MSNPEIKDDESVIYGCPERTAGTPESYRKFANSFEDASCALAALGDLMINAQRERLSEHTFEGIGYLLNMLGDKLLQDCFDALEVIPDAENQQAEHDSVSAQKQH
ncbi:MAG: hypothetical protein MRJ52_13805 [Nitrosomonas sp.]|nr:hypothetical protein [Nitrosomonas sp.]